MNRTYSHCFRPFTHSKNKCARPTTNYEFRTLLKFRNNHKAYEKPQSNATHETTLSRVQQPPLSQDYETAGHQQMRQFIKVMKNTNKYPQNSNPPPQQTHDLQLCSTSRSNRSKLSASNLKSTRLACEFVEEQPMEEKQHTSLEEIERRVEQLIMKKIGRRAQLRSRQLRSSRIDELDRGLKQLVEQVQRYTNVGKNSDSAEVDIKDIKKKISIYEKALASSCTQNQIIKKMYSSTQKVRKTYAVLNDRKHSQLRSLSASQNFLLPSPPSIQFETTNRSHFIKPSRNSYLPKECKKTNYILNRQPFPRSLYQRQFLYYGIVPTYSANMNGQNCPASGQNQKNFEKLKSEKRNRSEVQNRPTLYTKEYKQKQVHIVDSKQLDCRQDKFRNVNITFMPKKKGPWKGQALQESAQVGNMSKIELNKQNRTDESWLKYSLSPSNKQNTGPAGATGKTQHQSQYKLPFSGIYSKNINEGGKPECLMKQKNLEHLKYSYKYQYSYV